MTSFFQNQKARARETLVKESLTKALNEAVKNVQLNKTLIENDAYVTSDDAAKSLLVALEAIFIHGVKETFAEKFSSAFGDPDRMPAPEFWTPMMIFTPRHTISQVMNYAQIANDVGRSRSWIRVCLNDGFFLGYLMTIAQESKSLKPYYKNIAYLVDQERINIAISYFQGLSQFKFSFPSNSRFLNCWSTNELLMAGYYTPSMKLENLPVSSGTDIAKTIPDEDSDDSSVKSFSSAGTSMLNIDHDKALEMILSTPTDGSPLMRRVQNETKVSKSPRDTASSPVKFLKETPVETKDVERTSSEHTEDSDTENETPSPSISQPGASSSIDIPRPNVSDQTAAPAPEDVNFRDILNEYQPHPKSSPLIRPKLEETIERFNTTDTSERDSDTKKDLVDPLYESTFEFIEDNLFPTESSGFKHLVDLLRTGKMVQEAGLISQEFACKDCETLMGFTGSKASFKTNLFLGYVPAWAVKMGVFSELLTQREGHSSKVCSLSGFYYCADCFKNVDFVIPGRIVHNWDFMKYPVSPHSSKFLHEIQMHPLINLRVANPQIYLYVEEMHIIQKQRLKLNLLRQYLFTCHDSTKNRLQNLLWPREYLYEHVHLYSIMDLMEAASGTLQMLLKKAINLSEEHVKSCQLCSQKGFICEICQTAENSPPPIFPFDIDNIFRCSQCRSIYHKECMKKKRDEDGCPKCNRIHRRRIQMERNLSTEN